MLGLSPQQILAYTCFISEHTLVFRILFLQKSVVRPLIWATASCYRPSRTSVKCFSAGLIYWLILLGGENVGMGMGRVGEL